MDCKRRATVRTLPVLVDTTFLLLRISHAPHKTSQSPGDERANRSQGWHRLRKFSALVETVVQRRCTDAAQRKISLATWKLNRRIHTRATILSSWFPPRPLCSAPPLPRICLHPDKSPQGSCVRRELECWAGENLQPLEVSLGKCVPLRDICAALGTLARAHGERGSNARNQAKSALQPLPLNKASPL